MRILHIVYSCIPGDYRGGISRVVFELSRAQTKLGHDVTIFTTNTNSYEVIPRLENQKTVIDGVRIHYFQVSNTKWFSSPSLRDALKKSSLAFDVVHGHNTFLAPNVYAASWQRSSGRRLFYHIHGALDPVAVNRGIVKRLRKLAYWYFSESRNYLAASCLFALTDEERRQLKQYNIKTPIAVVPNGIERLNSNVNISSNKKIFPGEWDISPSDLVILYLGRIVPKKGLHLLLQAVAKLRLDFPKIKLVIAGDRMNDPAYTASLDKLVHELQLNNVVRWIGFLDESAKKEVWQMADIFSHVTESEGMAMAPLEAMAMGKPVLVSPQNNMSVAANAGAVMETPFSVNGIIKGLKLLAEDSEYRRILGQQARVYVNTNHNWHNIAAKILEIYDQAAY